MGLVGLNPWQRGALEVPAASYSVNAGHVSQFYRRVLFSGSGQTAARWQSPQRLAPAAAFKRRMIELATGRPADPSSTV
jgi:hypothetical protein